MKSKELSFDSIRQLFTYAQSRSIDVFATAHDDESLEFLCDEMGQAVLKVGSGESHNFEFLKKIGARRRPVIISFGLQSDEEIKRAVKTLQEAGSTAVIALHCVTMYPTPYEHISLPRLRHLQEILGVPTGLSDHSRGMHVAFAAISFGASVIEKHLTFDKEDPRSLDNPGALLPDEFKTMVSNIRDLELAMREPNSEERARFLAKSRDWAGQSIVAVRDLEPGEIVSMNTVGFKRPAKGGLPPSAIELILGKRIKTRVEADEQVRLEYIEL